MTTTEKKTGAFFLYDPADPPTWARVQGIVPPAHPHLSLEDRARQQRQQRQAQSPTYRARAPQARPTKSGDDQALDGKFIAVLVVLLVPTMAAVLWWFGHISPHA